MPDLSRLRVGSRGQDDLEARELADGPLDARLLAFAWLSMVDRDCVIAGLINIMLIPTSLARAPAEPLWPEPLVSAIILWNTRYLERAIATLREVDEVPDQLLAHLSPLGWEHVNLTGDYIWEALEPTRKTVTDCCRSGSHQTLFQRPPDVHGLSPYAYQPRIPLLPAHMLWTVSQNFAE